MLRAQLCVRTVAGFSSVAEQSNAGPSISNSRFRSSSYFSIHLILRTAPSRRRKSGLISCKSSRGSFGDRSTNAEDREHDYLEAVVLISETMKHYRMRRQGFVEETKWHASSQLLPSKVQAAGSGSDVGSVGLGFLRRFQSPTIFLKISCDGDFVLPIIVGELAVEKLLDASRENENGDCPSQFQLVRNLVGKLGYKVKMVRITKRVVSTYFARIYFSKPGEKDLLSVDARPSDAINVAKRCKAPIYVSKQVVFTDAIRIVYGSVREHDKKTIYDVYLDSAADGPNLLAEELEMVRNLNLAVREERYNDAVMWRDRLSKLRESRGEH